MLGSSASPDTQSLNLLQATQILDSANLWKSVALFNLAHAYTHLFTHSIHKVSTSANLLPELVPKYPQPLAPCICWYQRFLLKHGRHFLRYPVFQVHEV